jgi:hypothetical protein
MKIVRTNLLKVFLLLSLLISSYISERIGISSNFSLAALKLKHKKNTNTNHITEAERLRNINHNAPNTLSDQQESSHKSDDLPLMPVYFQGWVKYFRYIKIAGSQTPSKFFKNDHYFNEQKNLPHANAARSEKDQYGHLNIPDDKHFFAVVYPTSVNILKTRGKDQIAQVYDSLSIHNIKSIPDDNNFKGGVKDFGTFSEGSCIEITSIRPEETFQMSREFVEPPEGMTEIWLMCLDTVQEKNNLMNILIKLKLKLQHMYGVYLYAPVKKNDSLNVSPPKVNSIQRATGNNFPINNPNAAPNDGSWVLLQDWSQCTLKCGGGLQYQQLMCVPPKNGGKPCEGPSIRTRPCNTEACPSTNNSETTPMAIPRDNIHKEEPVLKPIIKMMALSKRPQQYDKCYLKESDAMYTISISGSGFKGTTEVPCKIIMNNKTVNIYSDENLQNAKATFLLRNTEFKRLEDNHRCFLLVGQNNKAQICQLDPNQADFLEQWDYDFNLFKYQCKEKRPTYDIDPNGRDEIKKEFDSKVEQIKTALIREQHKNIIKKTTEKDENKLVKKVKETQKLTVNAMTRENRLEQLLENEEKAREMMEQDELQKQFEAEKKKHDCLLRSIKEKQLEEQYNLSKVKAQEAIEKIKNSAKQEIMIKRNDIKKKLALMRKKNERKKQEIKNQIISLRIQEAQTMSEVSKMGDRSKCIIPPSKEDPHVQAYCDKYFPADVAKYQDCTSVESFCFVCCENEFGDLHLHEREMCFKNQCEPVNNPAFNS